MRSQNDIYHGDEHLTDKPQKYVVRLSEVIFYEVEVEAFDEDEAIDLAWDKLSDDYNGTYVVDQTGFQVDRVDVIEDIKVGGTD